jgi:hypothetical protein
MNASWSQQSADISITATHLALFAQQSSANIFASLSFYIGPEPSSFLL